LLPAGAIAGWALHPLESAALSRRTPTAVVRAGKRGAADPLECPKCKGPMRVIALIDDPVVVREILVHLGRWQPEALARAARAA